MKFLKIWVVALVAVFGLSSCESESNWIDVDYSNDLVGTWTCLVNGYAEALVISADGSVVSTGVENGELWKDVKGTIEVTNNKMDMNLENGDNFEGRFEIVPGVALSIFGEDGKRLTYRYCSNDLAKDIVGMWVYNHSASKNKEDMFIHTIKEGGIALLTGFVSKSGDYFVQSKIDYKVVGDLYLTDGIKGAEATQLTYTPDGTELGDILTMRGFYQDGDKVVEKTVSFLRIKQSLNLIGKEYEYSSTYVSNARGLDEEITLMGYSFNTSKMDGKNLDKMLKHLLFVVQFPGENKIKYQYHYNGANKVFEAPIHVASNMVTIKMSEMDAAYRDIDVYMFQDADDSQLHMYMPTYTFINYFANLEIASLDAAGEIDKTDAETVQAIFDRTDERIETINVSIVLKAAK